jgi:hypothetical protein
MEVSASYEAMGDLLSAVDGAAQASVAFRRGDRRGSALGAAGRARELVKWCGDVHTPAIADAAAPPVFTRRMREVVMLAGGGLTNREIAERLQLSVRTVEGLHRAAGRVRCTGPQRIGADHRRCIGGIGVGQMSVSGSGFQIFE